MDDKEAAKVIDATAAATANTLDYTEPTTPEPGLGNRLESIWGNFNMVTGIPAYSPKGFGDSIALDSTTGIVYYYDYSNRQWRQTATTLSADIIDALNAANSPSGANPFATIADTQQVKLIQGLTAGATISAGQPVAMGFYQSDLGIGYDASAASNGNATAGSRTVGFTVANNGNRVLVVFVVRNTGSGGAPSVAYNGVSMTNISSQIFGATSSMAVHAYALVAPATGSNNLVISGLSATENTSVAIYSYYNAKQTSNPSVFPTTSALSAGTIAQIVTPATAGARIVSAASATSNGGTRSYVSMNANQQTANGAIGTGGTITLASGDSYKIGPTVPTTISATSTVSQDWALSSVSIEPVTVAISAIVPTTAVADSGGSYGWNKTYRATAFIGFAVGGAVAGGAVDVITAGTVSGLSGLLFDEQYYLSNTVGQISVTPGMLTRKVGIALSSTALLITNNW